MTYSTNWTETVTHSVTLTYSSTDHIRHFLNSGGYLEIAASESITGTNTKNTSWKTLISEIGVITFGRSATTSTGSGSASSIGFSNITTTDQVIYQKLGPSYSPNQYRIYARKDSAGTSIIFTIQFADLSSQPNVPWGTDEPVIGTITSVVSSVRASGVNVSVVSPTVSSSSFGTGPANTAVPVISGTRNVGNVLTASTGTWVGPTPITYSYQWYRSTGVSLGTGSTYTIQSGDAGTYLYCAVTATNSYGSSTSTTVLIGPILSPPVNTVSPTITGTAAVNSTLTLTNAGTWTGRTPITYIYQWRRSNGTVVGANTTYTAGTGDRTFSLSCTVIASNADGTTTQTSNSIGPIP